MTEKDLLRRWRQSANKNLKTAEDMLKSNHYDWALFIGQLELEKLLKGLAAQKIHVAPPRIHDLNKLVEIAQIDLTENQKKDLAEITRFHIQARYDDVKYELYKAATKKYTEKWFDKIREYFKWLKSLY